MCQLPSFARPCMTLKMTIFVIFFQFSIFYCFFPILDENYNKSSRVHIFWPIILPCPNVIFKQSKKPSLNLSLWIRQHLTPQVCNFCLHSFPASLVPAWPSKWQYFVIFFQFLILYCFFQFLIFYNEMKITTKVLGYTFFGQLNCHVQISFLNKLQNLY